MERVGIKQSVYNRCGVEDIPWPAAMRSTEMVLELCRCPVEALLLLTRPCSARDDKGEASR